MLVGALRVTAHGGKRDANAQGVGSGLRSGAACSRLTTAASAQFASSIEGTITDSTGALVPGASVTIANEETGATQTVTTTAAGYYRFPALPGRPTPFA